jgi:glycosyltransferase involved in cell wall biosynthesis
MTVPIESPKISIIATSYTMDRLKDITELLDSIQAQAYKNIEVLVVTERSKKLTSSIQAYIAKNRYSNIRVLYNDGEWGSYPSRNLGIRQATGKIIAFIDDDALALPNWAEEMTKTYADDDTILGLTGPVLPLWQGKSMDWFPEEFYWIISCTNWGPDRREVRNGYCVNLSFRREAFEDCGLFKSTLAAKESGKSDWQQPGAEETEFCLRVKQKTGKRILYDPKVRVKHKVYGYRLTTKFIAGRAYWEGMAKVLLKRMYQSSDKAVLSTEYELLRRILFRLVPGSFKLLFTQPVTALRRLWVTTLVLSCVAAGYWSYYLRRING